MVMISHGISTGALFLLVGMLYERRHTRLIADYGGIARVVPVFSLVLTVVALSSIGLPGLNGFVGEFLVLLGQLRGIPLGHRHRDDRRDLRRGLPALGAAAHDLQPARQPGERRALTDLTRRELAVLLPLLVGIVWLGLYPAPGAPADGAGDAALSRGHRSAPTSTDARRQARRRRPEGPAMNQLRPLDTRSASPSRCCRRSCCRLVAGRPAGGELAARDRGGQPAGRLAQLRRRPGAAAPAVAALWVNDASPDGPGADDRARSVPLRGLRDRAPVRGRRPSCSRSATWSASGCWRPSTTRSSCSPRPA